MWDGGEWLPPGRASWETSWGDILGGRPGRASWEGVLGGRDSVEPSACLEPTNQSRQEPRTPGLEHAGASYFRDGTRQEPRTPGKEHGRSLALPNWNTQEPRTSELEHAGASYSRTGTRRSLALPNWNSQEPRTPGLEQTEVLACYHRNMTQLSQRHGV